MNGLLTGYEYEVPSFAVHPDSRMHSLYEIKLWVYSEDYSKLLL